MNGPQRVQPGQVLREYPGGSHNAFVAAWEKVFHDMPPGNGTGASGSSQRLTVQIENATGSDLGAEFPIVELGDPSVTPVDVPGVAREGVRLKGKLTTADTPLDKLAILKGPCPQGAFAPGIIAGPAWCSVNITDGNHTRAVPQASTAALASSHTGALMLWHEAGTGLKKALVLLGADGPEMVLVRVSANIAARSGATYSSGLAELIQADPDTGLLTGLDVSIEVANAFDQQISSGTYVLAVWDERNKQWFAVYPGKGQRVFLAKTSPGSGIAARSGTTVTSQSCEVFGITGTTLTTNSTFETVWNVSGQAVPADTYFPVVQEEITGKFIAAFGGSGGSETIIVKTSPGSGIAARSGVNLSSQSCEVFTISGATLVTTSAFETVYNISSRTIPADSYFGAKKDKNSGLYFAEAPGTGGGGIFKSSPGSGIAGRSGDTVFKLNCELYTIVGTTLTATGETADIYNIAIAGFSADSFGQYKVDEVSGLKIVDFEDCQ